MFGTPWHLFKWYSHMATSIPQPERKWEYKFYRECLHFSVFPNTWEKTRGFVFVKINLKERIYSKCISVVWILTILLDVVQIIQEKNNANNNKKHFECVFERHRKRLKNTFWNHPERKMFQKENYPKRTRNQHVSERVMTAKVSSGLRTPSSFNITWKKLFDFFV